MMGIIFSTNLILTFVFWEITGIVSWRLIGFFRSKKDVIFADKAFLVTVFGALLMLLGFITLYNAAGSFDYSAISAHFKAVPVPDYVVLLILAGIFSKSATLPFHTWLPDAGVAPSPVTALLHAAVLVKIGVYFFVRIFVAVLPLGVLWHTVIPAVALLSALVSAGAAMVDVDIKRIVAYSTVSQIGFIFFGLSTGNVIGVAGGLLYILMHGVAKAGLFLCAGIIEQNTHTKDITRMGGLAKTMPITAAAFLLCAFSVMGVPPLGGFFSKYMVFRGGIEAGNIWLSIGFMFAAFLTILYLFRLFKMVFLGDEKLFAKEGSPSMVYSVLALGVLSLVGGILIWYPSIVAKTAALQMLGMVK
jgi:NADH:ubiquinone oxidoreductase subunit 5 (subunit L)/multisubunit Na+/H+ antiporter MnhA subunit